MDRGALTFIRSLEFQSPLSGCLGGDQVLVYLVVLVASVLNEVQVGQVEVSELVVFLVNPQHEVQELVQQHQAMLESNVVAQVIQVHR